jgi:hypothetical protein
MVENGMVELETNEIRLLSSISRRDRARHFGVGGKNENE